MRRRASRELPEACACRAARIRPAPPDRNGTPQWQEAAECGPWGNGDEKWVEPPPVCLPEPGTPGVERIRHDGGDTGWTGAAPGETPGSERSAVRYDLHDRSHEHLHFTLRSCFGARMSQPLPDLADPPGCFLIIHNIQKKANSALLPAPAGRQLTPGFQLAPWPAAQLLSALQRCCWLVRRASARSARTELRTTSASAGLRRCRTCVAMWWRSEAVACLASRFLQLLPP